MQKKILIIQNTLGVYSEVFLYRMLNGFKKLSVELLVGKQINKEVFPFDNVKQWCYVANIGLRIGCFIRAKLFRYRGVSTAKLLGVINSINASDADLVCFQFAFLPVRLGSDIAKINKPFCIIHHGTDLNRAREDKEYHERLKLVWMQADKLFFVSGFLQKEAIKLGCPLEKSCVNYLGVPDFEKALVVFKETGVFQFIMVARMTAVKNHVNIITAFSESLKESGGSHELVLIGGGELESEIHQLIKRLGVTESIRLMGELTNEQVISEIAGSDCVVLVSKVHKVKGISCQEEGLPVFLLEGGRMGKPSIAGTTGGMPEVVENGVSGYLVDPLSVTDIKEAMLEILYSPSNAHEMGLNAKKIVEKKFNFERQMRCFEMHLLAML